MTINAVQFIELPKFFDPRGNLSFYLFYPFKSNHSHLFWRGVGGEAVCFIWFMFIIASSQVHRTIRVDLSYLCSLIIKQLSRVRILIRVLRVQSVCAILKQHSPQGYSCRFAILVFVLKQQ